MPAAYEGTDINHACRASISCGNAVYHIALAIHSHRSITELLFFMRNHSGTLTKQDYTSASK